MAGLIREDDIAEVREKARIEDVISQYVTLKPAGGGALKGLCPFHDEKSPSFNVRPGRGYHCLAAETEVMTWDGIRPIGELAGTTQRILAANGRWVEAPFRSYGIQRLWKLTVTRNRQSKEIYATDEHRWFVRSGKDRSSRREVHTVDLRAGDRLVEVREVEVRERVLVHAGAAAGGDRAPGVGPDAGGEHSARGWVVQSVEPTDRVEEVYCAEVAEGHAFVLADNILTGNCFGCGEGGDVISFVMKHDGLSFTDAVQHLADKYGVQLRFTEGDDRPKRDGMSRQRLIAANRDAAAYYVDQLQTPAAQQAREFLTQRGFDKDAAETFGLGFAPRGGEDLYKYLRQKDYTDAEVVGAGLCAQGQRGHYDRFRGRLLWPIRDTSGETIGFGARRIFDDDRIEAKYLNTPETSLYKKSHVLYGIDLARRDIARSSQAVVVEGYTDVMACHLAGVPTAIATCGTAFGEDHGRVLRRLLHDHEEFRGEIIFTFDGDDAGQKAALKAFEGDQRFVSQTYVAVEPDGLDPCDLRIQKGDAAVRELVARRIPLYRFVLGNVVTRYDLDRADGRIDALRAAARLVSSIRDRSKVEAFSRELAGMVGVEIEEARAEVRRAASRGSRAPEVMVQETPQGATEIPDPRDPRFSLERDVLKLTLQLPHLVVPHAPELGSNDFTHPTYAALWQVVEKVGGPVTATDSWGATLRGATDDPSIASVINALGVEPLHTTKEPDRAYVNAHVFRLLEVTALRAISDLKSRLQRTNPVEHATEYNRMFGELVALEQHRRTLRERAIGSTD